MQYLWKNMANKIFFKYMNVSFYPVIIRNNSLYHNTMFCVDTEIQIRGNKQLNLYLMITLMISPQLKFPMLIDRTIK